MRFGELVRRDRGVRPANVCADAVPISPSYWCDIERGRRIPSRRVAERMCRIVGGSRFEWQVARCAARLGDDWRPLLDAMLVSPPDVPV